MAIFEQCLFPDEHILSGIFPGVKDIKLTNCHIVSNTFDTCTFCLRCENAPYQHYPKDLLIRLQMSNLADVAGIHRLAYAQLPDLVPPILDVGTTLSADARKVYYCVTAYCKNAVPLEDVWHTLDQNQQTELMNSVVHAVERLQKLEIKNIYNHGHGDFKHGKNAVGGPKLGFFQNMEHFLHSILAASDGSCRLLKVEGGIVLESLSEDMEGLELTNLELDELQNEVVLCHNDLEPRNILVRRQLHDNSEPQYDLAAIVDWEMAGFYPFAYEHGVKDTALGSSNLSFSWYTLFKERTVHLLPPADCHTKLIESLRIINEARKRHMLRNVGVRVQAKWINREQIERAPDPRQGWIRKANCQEPGVFTNNDQVTLELEVLRELSLE